MDHLLSSIVLAASSNLDNLGVGVAYGVQGRAIRGSVNYLIALISGLGTLLSMSAGEWVNDFMSEAAANAIGAGIMVAIGAYTLCQALREDTAPASTGASGEALGLREGVALALSLTFNNLGSGLGAGISHISIPLTTVITMAVSLAAIRAGCLLGSRASVAMSPRRLGIASGLVMMAVGGYEYFV